MSDIRDRIRELANGPVQLNQKQIGAMVGCSHVYVSRTLSGVGGNLTAKQKVQIAYLWGKDEIGAPEIAAKMHISVKRLYTFLKSEGLLDG